MKILWLVIESLKKKQLMRVQFHILQFFAKLPKVNIPVLNGKYNPDFGYVITTKKNRTLYLVIETKGKEDYSKLGEGEKWNIEQK